MSIKNIVLAAAAACAFFGAVLIGAAPDSTHVKFAMPMSVARR